MWDFVLTLFLATWEAPRFFSDLPMALQVQQSADRPGNSNHWRREERPDADGALVYRSGARQFCAGGGRAQNIAITCAATWTLLLPAVVRVEVPAPSSPALQAMDLLYVGALIIVFRRRASAAKLPRCILEGKH
jgi:hypothetical protein